MHRCNKYTYGLIAVIWSQVGLNTSNLDKAVITPVKGTNAVLTQVI